jgi:hypothetical protein
VKSIVPSEVRVLRGHWSLWWIHAIRWSHLRSARKPTPVHGSQHAGDKPVDTPTLLHKRHERAYPAFIVDGLAEMGKNHPLERVYLVLQAHQV